MSHLSVVLLPKNDVAWYDKHTSQIMSHILNEWICPSVYRATRIQASSKDSTVRILFCKQTEWKIIKLFTCEQWYFPVLFLRRRIFVCFFVWGFFFNYLKIICSIPPIEALPFELNWQYHTVIVITFQLESTIK